MTTILNRASRLFNRIGIISIILMLQLFSLSLGGQANQDIDPSLLRDPEYLAPVKADGRELFSVRGVASYTASIRAASIEKRLLKAASDPLTSPDSVKAILHEDGHYSVFAGTHRIMNVYTEDADAEMVGLSTMVMLVTQKIKSFIIQYRHDRSPNVLRMHTMRALLYTGIWIVALIAFIWSFRRLNEWFKRRIQSKVESLETVSFRLIQSQKLLKALHLIYIVIRFLIIIFITFLFVNYILYLFPGTRQAANYIEDLLLVPLRKLGEGLVEQFPNIIFLIVIFLITQYLLRLVKLFFNGIQSGGISIHNFDPEWAMPTYKIVRFFVVIFALVIAFPYIPGSGSSAFQGITVFLGLVFSLGSSSFISNIIAGYSMTYRRAFKKGDRIVVNDFMGFVDDQNLLTTRLRSVKNEDIIIPNSVMLNSSIKNYSLPAKQRGIILHTSVGIGYETPWRQVEAMLLEAARRTHGVMNDPPPYVLMVALGEFAVKYEINVYCNDPINMYLSYTSLHKNILDVFNENNVQIMTPAYEGDPEKPKVVPTDQWNLPLSKKE